MAIENSLISLETWKAIINQLLLIIWYGIRALLPVGWIKRKSVHNQTVLITGSGGKFGRLLAVRFAKLGAKLILWDVNAEANGETLELCRELTATAKAYTVDLSDKDATYRVGATTLEDFGGVDILVNNAAIMVKESLVIDCSDEDIIRSVNINLLANFWTVKLFLPGMMRRNHGHVVIICSASGIMALPYSAIYSATKHGLRSLGESVFWELASEGKDGVFTTGVCPDGMDGPMYSISQRGKSKYWLQEPEYVADVTMDAILTNTPYIYVPKYFYLVEIARSIMPSYAGRHFVMNFSRKLVGIKENDG